MKHRHPITMQRLAMAYGAEPLWDYEMDSLPPEKGGQTLCGKLGRKHRMKRWGPMSTTCVFYGCCACC